MQKAKILIFCMIFVVSGAFAQEKSPSPIAIRLVDTARTRSCWGNKFMKYYRKNVCDTVPIQDWLIRIPISYLPGNFYSAQLGFFCRQEIKMEKITGVPFKFRLGSVQQCDWLEGKRY